MTVPSNATFGKPLTLVELVLGLVTSYPETLDWNLCVGSVVRRECEVAVVASDPNYPKFHGNDFNRTAVVGLSPVEIDLLFS